MDSIIFNFIDKEGNERISIGSKDYYEQKKKIMRQLIKVIGIRQTEEQRYAMKELTQDELSNALIGFMKRNELLVDWPN